MYNDYALANPLTKILDKPKEDFTREDLLKVIHDKQIERITFHYTALDGKLKELKIPLPAKKNAEIVLTEGERVDGSSLFKGLVDTTVSDLYVVPLYKSAFLNPFTKGSLDFVCRYIMADGQRAPFTPDNILYKAAESFKQKTGLELHALGELEFFLFFNPEVAMYFPPKQMGYHASAPYLKSGKIIVEILRQVTQVVGEVKYAHSEVGFIEKMESANEELNGKTGEQLEVEFLSTPIEETADNILIAKWLIRNIAYRHGMLATFAPKLEDKIAGNGMHYHLKLIKDGKNVMVDNEGNLSTEARKMVGGLCEFADSLTAFGNTVSSSYLRLVPGQEAPTAIFWSDSNRSAMVRVPLGWSKVSNLAGIVNPGHKSEPLKINSMQTVELRTADGSANVHMLLAGIAIAAEWGLTNEDSLNIAKTRYMKGTPTKDFGSSDIPVLPASCAQSADLINKKRALYEKDGIFPPSIINYVIKILQSENDRDLNKHLSELSGKNKAEEIKRIMHKDIHRH